VFEVDCLSIMELSYLVKNCDKSYMPYVRCCFIFSKQC